ncbi:MAG: STAS domain-containing protein [bacterium]|nr:STAS domain-containing protein [bacterium]
MKPDVEINSLENLPGAALLKLPVQLAEAGAMRLVGHFKALQKSGVEAFLLDLGQTEVVTGAGLGALNHLVKESGGRLVLMDPSKKLRKLFEITGMLPPIAEGMAAAQKQLKECL